MALHIIRPEDEIVTELEPDDEEDGDAEDEDEAAKQLTAHEDKMRARTEDKSA